MKSRTHYPISPELRTTFAERFVALTDALRTKHEAVNWAEVASRLQMCESHLLHYRRGYRLPTLGTLVHLMEHTGKSPDWFLGLRPLGKLPGRRA